MTLPNGPFLPGISELYSCYHQHPSWRNTTTIRADPGVARTGSCNTSKARGRLHEEYNADDKSSAEGLSGMICRIATAAKGKWMSKFDKHQLKPQGN